MDALGGTATRSGEVSVSMGSPDARVACTHAFRTLDMRFPPGLQLPRHYHDEATFVVVRRGAFERYSGGRRFVCSSGVVFSEPSREPHSNRFGPSGARVLITQPTGAAEFCTPDELRPFSEPCSFRHAAVAHLASQLAAEIRAPDALGDLAIDGLVMQMLALAGRVNGAPFSGRPAWLKRVVEMIHDASDRRLSLSELAREVSLHPSYLSRAFHRAVGLSLANYARTVRLSAAADALGASARPIAEIALAAGFSDQSHFTRSFHAYCGVTPARFREAAQNLTAPVSHQ